MKNQVNDELAIKFFCILVLNKLLLPTAGNQIPKPVIEAVIDTEKLKAIDSCTIIYKALRDGIRSWKEKYVETKNPQITGCVSADCKYLAFLLLCTKAFMYCII